MRKVVFFDRDGVINNEENNYYICRLEEFFFNQGIIEALQQLHIKGFDFILVSNQGGIARELYQKKDTEKIHNYMKEEFEKHGIRFLEMYYCPHHPDAGKCLCRKPGTVFIEKAIARFDISAKDSWFIGDRDSDMEAGRRMGLQTYLVKANQDMSVLGRVIG